MTPVADIQVIEGVGEQWKAHTNNNNNNDIGTASAADSSSTNYNGKATEEEGSSNSSVKSNDVDSDDSQDRAAYMQAQGPVPVYSHPDYMNGFSSTRYPEPLTNGDTVMNGFHEPHQSTADDNSVATESLTPDELARLVRQQFEYYFSRENLSNDIYLVSQMDEDQYVPIPTVAGFKQIKKLTSDLEFIVDALKESPYIQLDATCSKVRANMKRCIVILREIPESTPIEEVQKLFTSEKCPKWTSCEFVNNDSWYVTFASEEDTQKAFQYIRQDVRTFQGRPIMARIKAKTLLSRTVFMPKNGARTEVAESPQAPFPGQRPFQGIQTNGGYNVQAPPVFQQSPYQYYIPNTAWMSNAHPHFYAQEALSAAPPNFQPNSFVSNGVKPATTQAPRQFHLPAKPRRPASTSSLPPSVPFRKDIEIPPRRQSLKKQDVPRFQRLKQDKERRQQDVELKKQEEPVSSISLAPENFPALPSPKSPSQTDNFPTGSTFSEASAVLEASPPHATEEPANSIPKHIVEKTPEPTTTLESFASLAISSSSNSVPAPCISYAQMAQKPILKTPTKDIVVVHSAVVVTEPAVPVKTTPARVLSVQTKNPKPLDNGKSIHQNSKEDVLEHDAPPPASGTPAPSKLTPPTVPADKNTYAAKSVQFLGAQSSRPGPAAKTADPTAARLRQQPSRLSVLPLKHVDATTQQTTSNAMKSPIATSPMGDAPSTPESPSQSTEHDQQNTTKECAINPVIPLQDSPAKETQKAWCR